MKIKNIATRFGFTAFAVALLVVGVYTLVEKNIQNVEVVKTPDAIVVEQLNKQKNVDTSEDDTPKSDTISREQVRSANKLNAPKQIAQKGESENQKMYYILNEPDDPYYGSGWAMQSINAPQAWDSATGSDSVVVAVLDGGFALQHQDLTNQWLVNTGESGDGKESDGLDNDDNGYVDDWRGWDFTNIDNDPQAGASDPDGAGVSHGSEVAGLVGAEGNNNIGIAAASWDVSLMPLQVMSDEGTGYTDDIVTAITYAVDNGADIINMSLGASGDDPAVRDAVDYAFANDVLVVAAAGNCGTSTQGVCANQPAGVVTFPASYDRVVAVGAIGQTSQRASFSSYGERLDIMAPGAGAITSTTWTAGNGTSAYKTTLNGTSYASPITASAAALIKSIRPNSSIDDLRALLMASTQKVASMSGVFYTQTYGHGLLDVGRSIEVARGLNSITEAEPLIFQAGNYQAEARYRTSDSLGSGCEVATGTYCTVWMRNTSESYDRFLPYQLTDANNEAGWTWSGAVLNKGEWEIRAMQGDVFSETPKVLFSK